MDTKNKKNIKKLVYCAVAIALSFATSYIRIIRLPFGGAVTLFSMLYIVLIANWYGTITGVVVGTIYGLLQFFQNPEFLSLLQVLLDYIFAFAALGFAGLTKNKKNGLVIGYILGIFLRGVSATLAGYVFWFDYMPDNFPKSIAVLYPIVYNFSYIMTEGILTIIVISIPAVKKAIEIVKNNTK